MTGNDAVTTDNEGVDVTVPLPGAYRWQPGPSLTARVEPRRTRQRTEQKRDPRVIGAVILIAAVAVAIALWLTAVWLRANDEPDTDPTTDAESAISTLYDMTAGEPHGHWVERA